MSFKNLGLCDQLLKAVKEQGYDEPTPVQKEAIPVILAKRDILAGAQTGTGKTAGFTLPMLELIHRHKDESRKKHHVRALILTPTRELALQVEESVSLYGKFLPYKSCVIFGGVKINPQITALRKGIDIVVATPGRLLDHISQKTIDLSKVDFLILDEADRMLDMGFINDIKKVLAVLPKQKQTLLFSATFSNEIKKLTDSLLNSPVLIEVARRNQSAEQIKQIVHPVDKTRKRELLTKLIKEGDWQQVLVFMRTKHGCNRLSEQLSNDGISSAAIHGNKSQNARVKALSDFKAGKVRVLVATDIAARGIDIDQLPHVVNFELPNVSEDYVHRIGRTGRAGNKGEAMSLVCVDENEFLANIEKLINKDIHKFIVKGFEPDPSIKAEPIKMGGGGGNRGRGGNSRSRGNNKPRNGGASRGRR
ncbi:MAG: DEAD/DEAH box helicase [Sulfurimonas sp.]|nr:DEAD/DEAH box helicase [Sulfurimonas sp.]MDQ7060601.1 DEAD/DEAH box helicase [Sulfurimonas sp.]